MRAEDVRAVFEPISKRLGKPVSYCLGVYTVLWQWHRYGLHAEPEAVGLMRLMPGEERLAFTAAFKEAGLLDKDGRVVDVFGWGER